MDSNDIYKWIEYKRKILLEEIDRQETEELNQLSVEELAAYASERSGEGCKLRGYIGFTSTEEDVKLVQAALIKLGFKIREEELGVFGTDTLVNIIGLQKSKGIRPDGCVGPETARFLTQKVRGAIEKRDDPRMAATVEEHNLVRLRGFRGRRVYVHQELYPMYISMMEKARADGIEGNLLTITGGFRSLERQATLFQHALEKYGSEREARKWVGRPQVGAPHSTGKAIDMYLGYPMKSEYVDEMRETEAYQWLDANARDFGFVNYINEPWHWEIKGLKKHLRR
tara:strand:+ start:1703 stop:2554 length:852 start_codon:yes stop_codon:yes gene_type:complete